MNLWKTVSRIAVIAACALVSAQAAFAGPDFKSMLKAADDMLSFPGKDFSATYTVVDIKPNKPDSVKQWSFFRRDEKDQIVMLTLKPEAQKGEGVLKVDDDIYMWQPDVGWTHYSMSKELQNTNAKTSDFRGGRLSEDYDITATASVTLGKYDAWEITLKAKTNEVSYDWLKVYIRKDKPIVLMSKNFSPAESIDKASLLRTVQYPPKYVTVGGKELPVETRMVDEVNTGNKTILSIATAKDEQTGKDRYLVSVGSVNDKGVYSDHLPDSTFTKAFLEKANKK
jgi:hypothetical protein